MKTFKQLLEEISIYEEDLISESHFEIGDEVECKESGMTGTVIKTDDPEVGKYYTVRLDDGKTMKYAPEELELV